MPTTAGVSVGHRTSIPTENLLLDEGNPRFLSSEIDNDLEAALQQFTKIAATLDGPGG